jgi:TonB family protein
MKKLLFLCCIALFASNCSKVEQPAPPTPAAPVVTDAPAEFIGGSSALMIFLRDNIKYPALAREQNIQGKVIATFTISTSGKVTDGKIKQSIHKLLDDEVLRVIELQPDWKPALQNGVAVESFFTLPVNFKIEGLKKQDAPYSISFED